MKDKTDLLTSSVSRLLSESCLPKERYKRDEEREETCLELVSRALLPISIHRKSRRFDHIYRAK